jgi:hypothetical protein
LEFTEKQLLYPLETLSQSKDDLPSLSSRQVTKLNTYLQTLILAKEDQTIKSTKKPKALKEQSRQLQTVTDRLLKLTTEDLRSDSPIHFSDATEDQETIITESHRATRFTEKDFFDTPGKINKRFSQSINDVCRRCERGAQYGYTIPFDDTMSVGSVDSDVSEASEASGASVETVYSEE